MAAVVAQGAGSVCGYLRDGLHCVAAAATRQLHFHPCPPAVPLRQRGQPRLEHVPLSHGQ